jgi:hypothetical protein
MDENPNYKQTWRKFSVNLSSGDLKRMDENPNYKKTWRQFSINSSSGDLKEDG